MILEAGRKQFSDVVGIPVTGKEKISVVFTGIINNKINSYFNPGINGEEKNDTFSMILAVALLLTIYPVGILLCLIVFLIAQLAVLALLKSGILNVKKITVLKEVIE